ncbi:hypothetical protein Q5752_006572 [Cryptotrichosporon argae]
MRSALLFLPLALAAPSLVQPRDALSLADSFGQVADLGTWAIGKALGHSNDENDDKRSIFDELRRNRDYSRIVKIIEFADMKDEFDQSDKEITFFAPSNAALVPISNGMDKDRLRKDLERDWDNMALLAEMLELDGGQLQDVDDRIRKNIAAEARRYLSYHTIPKSLNQEELLQRRTYPTRLREKDILDNKELRIQFDRPGGEQFTTINGDHDCIVTSCFRTGEGHVCHITSELPVPRSAFDEIFSSPHDAAIYSSLVQGLHGREELDYRRHGDDERNRRGTDLVTALVFYDDAFKTLPRALLDFLTGPDRSGERAARALMNCYVLPNMYLATNEMCVKREGSLDCERVDKYPAKLQIDGRTCKLAVRVDEEEIKGLYNYKQRVITVNGVQASHVDIPANNGILHTFTELPLPCQHVEGRDGRVTCSSWDNWAQWLPVWAEQHHRDDRDDRDRTLPRPSVPGHYRTNLGMDSLPAPQSTQDSSPLSPYPRHPLERALSPDLPTRDALYLFANFSSYMRSPGEGAEGIVNHKDFHDTVRLLEHARHLASTPGANAHVVHLKYRFQSTADAARSPYASGDFRRPANYHDTLGRLRNPVPQPFAVLHDPVVKIDLKENGVFHPLPAEAIFTHIAKACRPPPRIIVVSYVGSKITSNHLASIAQWARTSSPPIYVFSPLETRVRERRPLAHALGAAVPISMYACPPPPSPSLSPLPAPRAAAALASSAHTARQPSPPVAVLSVKATPREAVDDPAATGAAAADNDDGAERLPLWALAPGVGMLQGSTAASLGVKLDDFLAVRLVASGAEAEAGGGAGVADRDTTACAADLARLKLDHTPELPVRPSSTAPPAVKVPHPDRVVQPTLVPAPRAQSWATPTVKVVGWQKGRRELMEDVVHELVGEAQEAAPTECHGRQGLVRELLGLV